MTGETNYDVENLPGNVAAPPDQFNLLAQLLHWMMAAAILAMLFIGVTMMTSLTLRPQLLDLHQPLGIAILLLAIVRLVNRLRSGAPALPADIPRWQVMSAKASHWVLYALMFSLPLLGWGVRSAGGWPVTMFPGVTLPPIAPNNPVWYAVLRDAHGLLAWLLFAVVLMHLSAALMHAWVRRDGVFSTMKPWRPSSSLPSQPEMDQHRGADADRHPDDNT